MTQPSTNSWETESKSGLVSIGTHSLYLRTSGPPRQSASHPVIIFFTGAGMPTFWHIKLEDLLKPFARVYFYDRAGYGDSEASPVTPQTAEIAAKELEELMKAINVKPPYLLVGHSYGCIIAREYLALRDSIDTSKQSVVGMVLAEPSTELQYELLIDHMPVVNKLLEGVDYAALTNVKEQSGMTDTEWEVAMKSSERTGEKGVVEDFRTSGIALAEKRQLEQQVLDDRPLSVIRAFCDEFQFMYDEAVKRGNGTDDERATGRRMIQLIKLYDDQLKSALLKMSHRKKYRVLLDCGHDFIIRRPAVVAEEVKWVWDQCISRKGT